MIDEALDPIQKAICDAAEPFNGWDHATEGGAISLWTEHGPPDVVRPDVGFKVHVSASVSCAGEVLSRAIPILVRMGVSFKHAASVEKLAFLSSGKGGITQIGKFLTAYPNDSHTAYKLAESLHKATEGLQGPRILSERSISANSLVYYRYGGFSQQSLQLRTGRIVAARLGVNGQLEVDDRSKATQTPVGEQLSFESDHESHYSDYAHELRGKYVRIQQLYVGPKGSTWLGFGKDTSSKDLLIIKEAYAYVLEGNDGLDAKRRLRREAECLTDLGVTGVTPVVVDYWEEERTAFLVYQLVEGPTFASVLNALAAEGLRPPIDLLYQWTVALCEAVFKLHQRGYVVGDIKPENLIFTGKSFQLIDLELAGPPTSVPTGGMGTSGYCSPQQSDHTSGRSYLDDVYSIGATLLAAATTTDASVLPDLLSVTHLERSREPNNHIYSAIEVCLAAEQGKRFSSPLALVQHISGPRVSINVATAATSMESAEFMRLACEIGDALVNDAIENGDVAYWVSTHPIVGGLPSRDLYAGSAGIALFLCALYDATKHPPYLETALRCGRWLATTKPGVPSEVAMPGLFFGDCGPGLLYLRLYLSTGDVNWLSRAISVSEDVAKMPAHSPDLLTGAAGTGLFHLALWRVSRDETHLNRAFREAYTLLKIRASAQPTWVIPSGHESLSGNEYIGFAHGSAGIGYFLAECCLAGGGRELVKACTELADWIIGLARPCLADGSGFTWAPTLHAESRPINWCHGSAGIAKFLLKVHEMSSNVEHVQAAERAGNLLAFGAQWNGTTQCHGLAGNAETLVDISQHVGSDVYLAAARRLGENLVSYRTEMGWPSENRLTITPDLMVGQAGIGATFLRLARPEVPHLISIQAFMGSQVISKVNYHLSVT